MSSLHPRKPEKDSSKPDGLKPGNPLRALIAAVLPKKKPASALQPPPVAPKPQPPVVKAPPPIEVLKLPKGVGTQLRRAVGARSAPPVQPTPPQGDRDAGQAAAQPAAFVPAVRELKSIMRKLKAAPPPPVAQTPPEKPASSTKHRSHRSKRTQHRDYPIV